MKPLKMKVGLMLCRKNYCNSRFKRFVLVDYPMGRRLLGTMALQIKKKDVRGVRLEIRQVVARDIRQRQRDKLDEVYSWARIEAIRIFVAFASNMGFIVYQMDIKSTFLYGKIDRSVLSQPQAWYATLSTFLLKSRYRRGTIDKTLFIKNDKNDIMLVQVYVDDIIFGSTKRLRNTLLNPRTFDKDEESADVNSNDLPSLSCEDNLLGNQKAANQTMPSGILKSTSLALEAYSKRLNARAQSYRNPQQSFQIPAGDLFHGSARSRQLWLLLL
ncbi:putative ribonuclease H-like domain-containing protein [Tanacetum coccineum]